MNERDLEADLAIVRERGYSIAIEELEVGLAAIAAPVRDETGAVIATVAISGPAFRITPDRYQTVGRRVASAAEELSGKVDFK
jgi:DNA-binding IclR family transcriptional regulator